MINLINTKFMYTRVEKITKTFKVVNLTLLRCYYGTIAKMSSKLQTIMYNKYNLQDLNDFISP